MNEDNSDYLDIVAHYEHCLATHGDTPKGVDWPNAADATKRYNVMLDILSIPNCPSEVSLLDFGCGAGHMLEHLRQFGQNDVQYFGADISPCFIELCRKKFPCESFVLVDMLREPNRLPQTDFIVANGVFTEKRSLSWDSMWLYTQKMITSLLQHARIGLAFNVMSSHVDWTRDDLFHLPFDTLAAFLKKEISRNFMFRSDYGLYEYTTYVFHEAN